MPNRILKESITTSDTIDCLSAEEERLFYRLLVKCDDYGRFDARPLVILGQCFPLKIGKIGNKTIQRWLSKLEQVGLLRLYVAEDRPYLQMKTFSKHQQVRATKSRYPGPPDRGCNQLISTDGDELQPNADSPYSESESESESKYIGTAAPSSSSAVEEVWEYYLAKIQPKAEVCPTAKVKTRLKRFSVEKLKLAMDRFAANYWRMLNNAKNGGEWFFKSDSQIDKFLLIEPQTKEEYEAEQNRGRNGSVPITVQEPPEFVRPER